MAIRAIVYIVLIKYVLLLFQAKYRSGKQRRRAANMDSMMVRAREVHVRQEAAAEKMVSDIYLHIYLSLSLYICIYICLYVYIYI